MSIANFYLQDVEIEESRAPRLSVGDRTQQNTVFSLNGNTQSTPANSPLDAYDADRVLYTSHTYKYIVKRNRLLFRVIDDTNYIRPRGVCSKGFASPQFSNIENTSEYYRALQDYRTFPTAWRYLMNAFHHIGGDGNQDSVFISTTMSLTWAIHEMHRRSAYPSKGNVRIAIIDGSWTSGAETSWRILHKAKLRPDGGYQHGRGQVYQTDWEQKCRFAYDAQEVLVFGYIAAVDMLHNIDVNGQPHLISWNDMQRRLPTWYRNTLTQERYVTRVHEKAIAAARLRVSDEEAAAQAEQFANYLLRESGNAHRTRAPDAVLHFMQLLAEGVYLWGTGEPQCRPNVQSQIHDRALERLRMHAVLSRQYH